MHLFQSIPDRSVLGINYSGMHDSTLAVVGPDGAVAAACALERLTRCKQDGRPPAVLLEGVPWERIAGVALSTLPEPMEPADPASVLHPVPLAAPRAAGMRHGPGFDRFLDSLPGDIPRIWVDHHDAHAASAFYLSGFDESLVLTYDGGMGNCPWFGGLYRASYGKPIEPLDRFAHTRYAKVCSLYSTVTGILGFTPNKHEGKVTGLAARGRATDACRRALEWLFHRDYGLMESMSEWIGVYGTDDPPSLAVRGPVAREIRAHLAGCSREDISATVQLMAEEHILEILGRARERGWTSSRIGLAGGLFANVKINQRVRELGFEEIFVAPPMTDDGTALGAALAVVHERRAEVGLEGEPRAPEPVPHMFLGVAYEDEEIGRALDDAGLEYRRVDDPAAALAERLAAGQVVALFEGAMEFGPRALGHRSILSQATDPEINQTLNHRLRRTEFMPFAPITRVEDLEGCYVGLQGAEHTASFMTITTACTPELEKRCPAVVHVDGTARPQLVNAREHPLLHRILGLYLERTGNPALINTSFNIHEEPIVGSPEDAVAGFLESGVEVLYLQGGYLVDQAENREAALARLRRTLGTPSQKESRLEVRQRNLEERLHALAGELEEKEQVIQGLRRTAAAAGELPPPASPPVDLQAVQERLDRLERALEQRSSSQVERLDYLAYRFSARFWLHLPLDLASRVARLVGRSRRLPEPPTWCVIMFADRLTPAVRALVTQAADHDKVVPAVVVPPEAEAPLLHYLEVQGVLVRHRSAGAGLPRLLNDVASQIHADLYTLLTGNDILLPGAADAVTGHFQERPQVMVAVTDQLVDLDGWLQPSPWERYPGFMGLLRHAGPAPRCFVVHRLSLDRIGWFHRMSGGAGWYSTVLAAARQSGCRHLPFVALRASADPEPDRIWRAVQVRARAALGVPGLVRHGLSAWWAGCRWPVSAGRGTPVTLPASWTRHIWEEEYGPLWLGRSSPAGPGGDPLRLLFTQAAACDDGLLVPRACFHSDRWSCAELALPQGCADRAVDHIQVAHAGGVSRRPLEALPQEPEWLGELLMRVLAGGDGGTCLSLQSAMDPVLHTLATDHSTRPLPWEARNGQDPLTVLGEHIEAVGPDDPCRLILAGDLVDTCADPLALLSRAGVLLAPDGCLALAVETLPDDWPGADPGGWPGWCRPGRRRAFTAEGMDRLLRAAGLRVVHRQPVPAGRTVIVAGRAR